MFKPKCVANNQAIVNLNAGLEEGLSVVSHKHHVLSTSLAFCRAEAKIAIRSPVQIRWVKIVHFSLNA